MYAALFKIASRSAIVRLLAVLVASLLAGCGGSAERIDAPAEAAPLPRELGLDDALAELDALEVPAGIDAAVWAELKGALAAALEQRGQGRMASAAPQNESAAVDDLVRVVLDGGPGLQWTYRNPADYNNDGEVNAGDLVQIALYFGVSIGDPRWAMAQRADGDGNGEVNAADIVPLAANFLNNVAAWRIEAAHSEEGPWTTLGQVPQPAGERSDESAAPLYSTAVEPGFSALRVVPLSFEGEAGVPSNIAAEALVAQHTQVVGEAKEDSPLVFLHANSNSISFHAPGDHGLDEGGVLIGEEQGGYIFEVQDLVAAGDIITVFGSHGSLQDVMNSGTLRQQYSWFNPATPLEDLTLAVGNQLLHIDEATLSLPDELELAVGFDSAGWNVLELGLAQKLSLSWSYSLTELSHGIPEVHSEQLIYEFPLLLTPESVGALPLPLQANVRIYLGAIGPESGDVAISTGAPGLPGEIDISLARGGELSGTVEGNEILQVYSAEASLEHAVQWTVYLRVEYRFRAFGASHPGGDPDFILSIQPTETVQIEPVEHDEIPGVTVNASRNVHVSAALGHSLLGNWEPQSTEFSLEEPLSFGPAFFAEPEVQLHHIGGRVFGGPFGVEVRATQDGVLLANSFTDNLGRYGLNLPLGAHVTLTPVYAGYTFSPPSRQIIVTGDASYDFVGTAQTGTVSGKVTLDGSPVSGVSISLSRAGAGTLSALTDAQGNYLFDDVPLGSEVTLTPQSQLYIFAPSSSSFTLHGDSVQNFVAWPLRHTLSGFVRTQEGNHPVSGVMIEIYDASSSSMSPLAITMTNSVGHYEFIDLEQGIELRVVPHYEFSIFDPSEAFVTIDGPTQQNFFWLGFDYSM